MISVKTMKQIATSRMIPGCRSVNHLSGQPLSRDDRARIATGLGQMRLSEARRQWLNQMYSTRSL